jgi:glycosyltransferase involved in cell wall biosynthesis
MRAGKSAQAKLIAFYLPQFHPTEENDEWWGKGFTEWNNVVRGVPAFSGHAQPQLPTDLGFYDLRVPEVRAAQADLARQYGISGFCYYYYWFDGKKLLDRPLNDLLQLGEPDFPFCICWANENWTRRWDGLENEILVAQHHSPENDERFLHDVLPILRDPRYIRIDGKPLLLVYRVSLLPDPEATARRWRELAREAGLGGLYLCAVQSFGIDDPRTYGFDAAVEFPPHPFTFPDVRSSIPDLRPDFDGHIADYRDAMQYYLARPDPEYTLHRGVMVAWDNSARRGHEAYLFRNSTPELYEEWLTELVRRATSVERGRRGQRAEVPIFVNGWNEWAEGAHLEPDNVHGHRYLEATKRALDSAKPTARVSTARRGPRRTPLVTVVVPSYNHALFVEEAIRSVAAQTYGNTELVVVDDGSTDDSLDVIHEAIERYGFDRSILKVQPNLGAAVAIDRGVMLGSGEYIAILNSDDSYAPDRLERLVENATELTGDCFLFSLLKFHCSSTASEIQYNSGDSRIQWYADAMRLASALPTAGFGFLCGSLTVTTSNFFFNRDLFTKLRGFNNSLLLAHDWDFALRALCFTEPILIPEPLVTYRYHSTNAHAALDHVHLEDGLTAVGRFLDLARTPIPNSIAPTPQNWPEFFAFFSAHIRPWFSDEPLESHLGILDRELVGASAARSRRLVRHEREATDALSTAIATDLGEREFSEAACRDVAHHWQAMRRSLATPVARRKPKLEPVRASRPDRSAERVNGEKRVTTSTRRRG